MPLEVAVSGPPLPPAADEEAESARIYRRLAESADLEAQAAAALSQAGLEPLELGPKALHRGGTGQNRDRAVGIGP